MQRTREERKCFGCGDFEYIAYHCKKYGGRRMLQTQVLRIR